MIALEILIGGAVLILGRKLYWLFVGAAGFLFGIALVTQFSDRVSEASGLPGWAILLIALGAGVLGALLAVFLQRLALGLAGFIGGGSIVVYLLDLLGWDTGRFTWVTFIVGGIIGVVLVGTLFEWALIVLSSLSGASLIAQAAPVRPLIAVLLFVVLAIAGIAIQANLRRREQKKSTSRGK